MGLFNKMKEPVFLKENSNIQDQLEKLKSLEPLLNSEGQAIIKQDIKFLEYGIVGEKSIAFELKNSHLPMYILHDIYLEVGDLSAQIDYLVFTRKICFVIECKNLYGDIEINSAGDFIRTTEFGGRKKKEGIYSPITQNQRHLELMKKLKVQNKSNILIKHMVEKYFEQSHKSVVVLANPKTVLNAKFTKKELKEKVIRVDQLINYIKDMNAKSEVPEDSDERLQEWAQFFLNVHKEVDKDYTQKYEPYKINTSIQENSQEVNKIKNENSIVTDFVETSIEETEIFKELKVYRLNKSREENIKPYFIYNDSQLKDLISKMPRSKEELKLVAGFGEVKANKYGDDIFKILEKF